MKELSLNILDIVQNSITAKATLIGIHIEEQPDDDLLTITISDNGSGMDEEMVKKVINPFTTSRTTRKVGLGIPLFMEGAEATGGKLTVESKLNVGTIITAEYGLSHIDRMPLGDIGDTVLTLIICNPELDFEFLYRAQDNEYSLKTMELRDVLGGVPLNNPDVADWIKENLKEGIAELNGKA